VTKWIGTLCLKRASRNTFTITKEHDIHVSVDRTISQTEHKWTWDGDTSYTHFRAKYLTSWEGFDHNFAAKDTRMNNDTRVVLSVSRMFSL
jgi:hypothetical protein